MKEVYVVERMVIINNHVYQAVPDGVFAREEAAEEYLNMVLGDAESIHNVKQIIHDARKHKEWIDSHGRVIIYHAFLELMLE